MIIQPCSRLCSWLFQGQSVHILMKWVIQNSICRFLRTLYQRINKAMYSPLQAPSRWERAGVFDDYVQSSLLSLSRSQCFSFNFSPLQERSWFLYPTSVFWTTTEHEKFSPNDSLLRKVWGEFIFFIPNAYYLAKLFKQGELHIKRRYL